MIIGITGYYASGKDTVAEYLQKKGFQHFSLSDEIRHEATKKNIPPIRDNLIKLGNDLREKFGPGILAQRINLKLKENKNYVITSIRNPEEINNLNENQNFILISVEAEQKKRFELLKQRARENDPKTFQEFVEKEKIEESSDPNKQQLNKCAKLAKFIIENNGTLEELHTKTEKLLRDLRKKYDKRPSWDEYFIRISQEVAKRATCDRGKSGCVIVRDRRILCTGYVGSTAGLPHCDDAGHQIKKITHEDGHTSQHCVRTIHAEQNALCQAAHEGISLKGATVYCKMEPCSVCAKMIVNSGIIRVVCEKRYHGALETTEIFKQAKIKLDILDKEIEKYRGQ